MGKENEAGRSDDTPDDSSLPAPDDTPETAGAKGGGPVDEAEVVLSIPSLDRVHDDAVEEAEQDLIDEDYADTAAVDTARVLRERGQVERAQRHLEDQIWLVRARAAGFSGSEFAFQWEEFARYAVAVVLGWTRTGKIFAQCKTVGRPVNTSVLSGRFWTRDDRGEIAGEAVTRGLRRFLEDVLKPGKWDPLKGASLKTYLVGAVLLQFPNVFNSWAKGEGRWARDRSLAVKYVGDEAEKQGCHSDPTHQVAVEDLHDPMCDIEAILESIPNPTTRGVARLIAQGKTYAQAGEASGLTEKAVGERIRRLRSRMKKRRDGDDH